MKKIITIDLDGTLLETKSKHIPETTFDYLMNLNQKGNIICIATRKKYELSC